MDSLSNVAFHVVVQVALSYEGRRATGLFAHIGSKSSVRANVSLKISFFVEALSTLIVGTDERLVPLLIIFYLTNMLPYMGALVYLQTLLYRISFIAARVSALENAINLVGLLVVGEVRL
jgi:hypothetical protein